MKEKAFDLVVLGGGPGGYPAAIRAAQLGKKVALIEADQLGGTCLNRGCIPSKALIAGAEFIAHLKKAPHFGVQLPSFHVDFAALAAHKESVVHKMRGGLESLVKQNGIEWIRGFGTFVSPKTLKVEGTEPVRVEAQKIIIATGSRPRALPHCPFDHSLIHDSTSLMELKELPKRLLIIGGGVIGCEFASLYAHLGVEVTLLELLPRIIAMEALELSEALSLSFSKRGIKVLTGVQVSQIERTDKGLRALLAQGASIEADACLIAVGRSLNTQKIGLEKTGVFVEENGLIAVNEKMETSVDGIYAVGDIASKWWLAHVASHQGIVAAENACGGVSLMSYEAIPSVIFTDPEIGSVGLSLEEAKKRGFRATLGSFPFQAIGKSQAVLHPEGFAQIVVEEGTGRLLGAQVMGHEATTLIASMVIAIANELTLECLNETVFAHPSLSEVWGEAAWQAAGKPLHLPKRK